MTSLDESLIYGAIACGAISLFLFFIHPLWMVFTLMGAMALAFESLVMAWRR